MTNININILPEDVKKADSYISNGKCLLATAVRREFPYQPVAVFPRAVQIGKCLYELKETENQKLHNTYAQFYRDSEWKNLKQFKPFKVSITYLYMLP